ncbi:hypothetical protein FB45DRAFT_1065447 [Roridomyces roridus]|uniref:Uncharacterized protein n=1 Tax=Roridomyces roridus TaxID=1738132 RepID=A0AAD7B7D0_9AGAR|nr:hypothetical protein FB45DRAFT_1065447 [Roridomyces roridus]
MHPKAPRHGIHGPRWHSTLRRNKPISTLKPELLLPSDYLDIAHVYNLILAEDTRAVDTGFYKLPSVDKLLKLRAIGLVRKLAIQPTSPPGSFCRHSTSDPGDDVPTPDLCGGIWRGGAHRRHFDHEDEEIAAARGILERFDFHEDDGNSGIDVYCRVFLVFASNIGLQN